MFQNSVEEKLIRERTGYKSNALFLYEKGSKTQLENVSKCLGPVNDTRKSEFTEPCTALAEDMSDPIDDFFFDYVSDSVLASIPSPENKNSGNTNRSSNMERICTNSMFNNCTINFVVNERN